MQGGTESVKKKEQRQSLSPQRINSGSVFSHCGISRLVNTPGLRPLTLKPAVSGDTGGKRDGRSVRRNANVGPNFPPVQLGTLIAHFCPMVFHIPDTNAPRQVARHNSLGRARITSRDKYDAIADRLGAMADQEYRKSGGMI